MKLSSVLVLVVVISIVTWLCVYLDARATDKPKKRSDYIKTILLTNAISIGSLFALEWLSPNNPISNIVKSTTNKIAGETVKIAEIGEDMLKGEAPF